MRNNNLPKWQTTQSRYIVDDRWLRLRADTCVTPDGDVLEPWYVLEYPEWVNCLVIDDKNQVIMLRHYRHGIDDYVLEIVGAGVEPEDASPQAAIERELQEEIGYSGGKLFQTGVIYTNPSMQNNKNYCFLAVGGTCGDNKIKEIGADFLEEKIPFESFVKRITEPNASEVYQSLHLANIFLTLNLIRTSSDPMLAHFKKYL